MVKKFTEIPAPRILDLENTGIKDTKCIMRLTASTEKLLADCRRKKELGRP